MRTPYVKLERFNSLRISTQAPDRVNRPVAPAFPLKLNRYKGVERGQSNHSPAWGPVAATSRGGSPGSGRRRASAAVPALVPMAPPQNDRVTSEGV